MTPAATGCKPLGFEESSRFAAYDRNLELAR